MRNRKLFALFVGALVIVLAVSAVAVRQRAAARQESTQANPTPGWYYNFAVKFVCGEQMGTAAGAIGEPTVKPGNYATDINIHNPTYQPAEAQLFKKVVTLVDYSMSPPVVAREPAVAPPSPFVSIWLGPDFGTMDDCNAIWAMTHPTPPPSPMPLFIGFLVILSRTNLDVVTVYTANGPLDPALGLRFDISEEVEIYQGKRVYYNWNPPPPD